MKKILIIDDDVGITNYLRIFFMQTGEYAPTVVNDSTEAPELLSCESFDLLLLDLDMPGLSGMDILEHIQKNSIEITTIVLTGVSDVELAVNAMKLGAFDFLTKPAESEHLLEVLKKACDREPVQKTLSELPEDLSLQDIQNEEAFGELVSSDNSMVRTMHLAEKLASSDNAVFITGESGTGKEWLANAIHCGGPRAERELVVVDAGAYDAQKLPVMLFGELIDRKDSREEQKGFIDQAAGGTLYIYNIENWLLATQQKMLRLIHRGEFYRERSTRMLKSNARIILASDIALDKLENDEGFDKALSCLLRINCLEVPPLRERKKDIPGLIERFIAEEKLQSGKDVKGVEPSYIEKLSDYSLPGNLHELRSIVVSSIAVSEEGYLTLNTLPSYVLKPD